MADDPKGPKPYIVPRSGSRLAAISALAAAACLVAGLGLYLLGWRTLASPGPLVAAHASLDAKCIECHGSAATADLRCERCHDPIDSRRFTAVAHVVVSTGDAWRGA